MTGIMACKPRLSLPDDPAGKSQLLAHLDGYHYPRPRPLPLPLHHYTAISLYCYTATAIPLPLNRYRYTATATATATAAAAAAAAATATTTTTPTTTTTSMLLLIATTTISVRLLLQHSYRATYYRCSTGPRPYDHCTTTVPILHCAMLLYYCTVADCTATYNFHTPLNGCPLAPRHTYPTLLKSRSAGLG